MINILASLISASILILSTDGHPLTQENPPTPPPVTGSFTDDAGNTSEYKILNSDIHSEDVRALIVRLHGDGKDEFLDDEGTTRDIARVARGHNSLVLSPLTPNKKDDTWWHDTEQNRVWLDQLIWRIQREYNLQDRDLILDGYSGGAEFISTEFLPRTEHTISGALITSGGDVPRGHTPQRSIPLSWIAGTEDTAENAPDGFDGYGKSRAGSSFYQNLGYSVSSEWLEGVDHYGIDHAGELDKFLSSNGY